MFQQRAAPRRRSKRDLYLFAEAFHAKLVVASVAEPVAIADDAFIPGDTIGLSAPAILPVPDSGQATRELEDWLRLFGDLG